MLVYWQLMLLRYHAKALQLAGVVPKVAPHGTAAIDAVEHRVGRPLLASLREWYSLDGACDILRRCSNDDPPVAVADLGQDGLIAGDLLVIRYENQGVCSWAVQLNGCPDPPVLVDYDTGFEAPVLCTNTFSEYVYSCVWDWELVLYNALIQAQNQPLSEAALDFLRRAFAAELVTHGWPGDAQYRFFNSDQRVLVWAGKDQADWWLSAASDDAMLRLMRTLWEVDELGGSLWSHDAAGEALLQRARAGFCLPGSQDDTRVP